MKHPTDKRPPRSLLARLIRALWRWVDERTRNEYAGLPRYDEVKARAKR